MTVEAERYVVASVDREGRIAVHRGDFRSTWTDEKTKEETTINDVRIRKMDDGWHLVIKGTREDNNSLAFRTPVEFTPDGSLTVMAGAPTQSCTGCSHCDFPDAGGCVCVSSPIAVCIHTIQSLESIPGFLVR